MAYDTVRVNNGQEFCVGASSTRIHASAKPDIRSVTSKSNSAAKPLLDAFRLTFGATVIDEENPADNRIS
jgi:hypothetical protein